MKPTAVSPANSPSPATAGLGDEAWRDAAGHLNPGWRTTLAAFAGLMLGPSTVLVFCFGTFVAPLQREFGWSIADISLGGALITAMVVLTSILAGHLADRWGARRLVLASLPLFGLAVSGLYFLPASLPAFYAALTLAALLGAGAWPVVYNQITASWFDRRLGLSLGLANAGVGVGAALLPALLAVVIPAYGWRAGYLVLGLLVIAVPWPMALRLLQARPRPAAAQAGSLPAAGLSFRAATRTPQFWRGALGFFVLGAASSSLVFHQVRILLDAGLPPAQAAGMQSVLGVALIVGRVVTGWLLDRVPVARVMSVLCLLAAGALALLASGPTLPLAVLIALAMGFVIGAEFDVLGFFVARYFGRRAFGLSYGTLFAALQIAGSLFTAGLGYVRTTQGSYGLALGVLAAASALATLLFVGLGPYRYAPPPRAR